MCSEIPTRRSVAEALNWSLHDGASSPVDYVLKECTPPKVRAAVFSTIWNRWNTGRRWQKPKGHDNQCLFRCEGEDSIEHYCHCNTIKIVMKKNLRLDPFYFSNMHTFTVVNQYITDTTTLTTVALLIYGVYNTTNALRAKDNRNDEKRWQRS